MRAIVVVLFPSVSRSGLSFSTIAEYLAVQTLVSWLVDETLNITVLPRAARVDE